MLPHAGFGYNLHMKCPKREVDNKYKTVILVSHFFGFLVLWLFLFSFWSSDFLFIWSSVFGLMDQLGLFTLDYGVKNMKDWLQF